MATPACLWSKCSWTEVWAKNMTNGRIAVVLFNRAGVLYDFGTYRPNPVLRGPFCRPTANAFATLKTNRSVGE